MIDLTEHGGGTIRLWDVDIDSLDADDFIFAEADSGAGSDNSGENLQSASATVSSTLATFSTSFENGEFQTSGHVTLRQLARVQPKALNFPVFLREKCTFCELLSSFQAAGIQ